MNARRMSALHTEIKLDFSLVAKLGVARSERFELPTLGIEIRCSIQLSYERVRPSITRLGVAGPAGLLGADPRTLLG
jgi:hypothetical protein